MIHDFRTDGVLANGNSDVEVKCMRTGSSEKFVGIEWVWLVRATGVGLVGFAGVVALVATRDEIDLRATLAIIAGDLLWVVGTVPILLFGLLSSGGLVAAAIIADIVLVFAALQYFGVRRIRARSAAAPVAVS